MAEKIVSPGVFTRENDLSFLAQGVANIGAAFIGPFKEGPVVPTVVESQAEFETLFGVPDGTYYTPIAVQNYLRESSVATICRVAGLGGYTEKSPLLLTVANGAETASVGIIFATNSNASGSSDVVVTDAGFGDFIISSSFLGVNATSSVDSTDANDIESLFGTNALGTKGGYVYGLFKEHAVPFTSESVVSSTVLGDQNFAFDAQEAVTPTIQSQLISGERHDLFKFYTLGVGNVANTKVKIAITNIKPAGSIAGSDYGTFSVFVRQFSDTNKKRTILEQFNNVTLDPNSPNYIARVIGDRSRVINTEGKISEYGDWANQSRYIRLWNSNDTGYKNANEIPVQAVPFAHAAYQLPVSASAAVSALIPTASFVSASATQFGGLDLDNNDDNLIYLKPIPTGATIGANGAYSLDTTDNVTLTNVLDLSKRNFMVCFQEGFDGMSPATVINLGDNISSGNSQGFDLSSSTSKGSLAYAKAIAALTNADEFDINMVATPGIIRRHHPAIVTSVLEMCENRADCFYIMDSTAWSDSPAQAITQASAIDSNYVATYYPWVKTVDINTNKLIQVPPSVLLPGVFAASDNVSAEWFAPAGLNRGGLLGAVSVQNRLTQAEKDDLYEGKVNPIVQFPGQGIVVFGQKTLQDRPSALDRINVRRLLLTVRKFIASSSRYLVFEQNSADTRQRFLQIVNPYLESIQQRQGLYAFKVVMDESNNTPDVIDRNILKGDIYLQPTKTAEFIVLDFNILPTGATFEG
jgi:phage tail sheath protein FI